MDCIPVHLGPLALNHLDSLTTCDYHFFRLTRYENSSICLSLATLHQYSRVAHMKYKNAEVKLRALKKLPRIQTPGIDLPEVQEGHEFVTWFWVAQELVEAGLAEYSEPAVSPTEWTQVHFKERINPAGPPSPLPEEFYERAYQSFSQVRGDPEKAAQLNRMRARYREILESRIGRITRLASSESISPVRGLTLQEIQLYNKINDITKKWREELRKLGEE